MVIALDPDRHEALLGDGTVLPFDLFLGVPVHRVPDVVSASGMTHNGWIPVDPGSGATRYPGVYAVGDVTSVGTPKAGVFAERAARVIADQLIARIRGEAEPPGYDGTGACWIELGNHEVAARARGLLLHAGPSDRHVHRTIARDRCREGGVRARASRTLVRPRPGVGVASAAVRRSAPPRPGPAPGIMVSVNRPPGFVRSCAAPRQPSRRIVSSALPPSRPAPSGSGPVIPAGPYPYVPRLPVPDVTPVAALDVAVAELRAAADGWVRATPEARIRLLDEVIRATLPVADRWTELASRHEGLDPAGPDSAEESIVGPYIFVRGARLHRDAIRAIARAGVPHIPGPVRTLPDGRVTARVFPAGLVDRATYIGTDADVWMDRAVTAESLPSTMATPYRQPPPGRVCLVLGGGNASSIGPLDVLHKLFVELQVVVLKMHPVMAHLDEVQAAALAPLVRAGVLRIVHGGAAGGWRTSPVTRAWTRSTSPAPTAPTRPSSIGTGPGGRGPQAPRRPGAAQAVHRGAGQPDARSSWCPAAGARRTWTTTPRTSSTMLTNNAGFNCTTSRVIVTAGGLAAARRADGPDPARAWPRCRRAWPTTRGRRSGSRPSARCTRRRSASARPGDGHLPWMLIPDLSPDAVGDPCYRIEAFCSVTAETTIDAPDAAAFLERAVRFANETLWGTLNATLIVDPRTARDPAVGPRCRAGDRRPALRDGLAQPLVGDRVRPRDHAVGRVSRATSAPDIGSGTGFVHNPLMFERVEKTVVRSPFRAWPKPIWFAGHRTAHRVVPHLVRFEGDRRPDRLVPIMWFALRG